MKPLWSLVLVFGIVLQMAGSLVPWLEYNFNKSFIVKQLCELKDVPDNHCEGKCHLKKQLQKESEREQNNPLQTNRTSFDWIAFDSGVQFEFSSFLTATMKRTALSENEKPGFPRLVFRPPGC